MKSILSILSTCETVDSMVREIFMQMHLLRIDMGKDEPSDNSSDFIDLYLSDDPSKRSKGVRLMSWIDRNSGIVTTKGDNFYLRSSYCFLLFVDETVSKVKDILIPSGCSLGNKVGVIDNCFTVDTFITLFNLVRQTEGNPSDINPEVPNLTDRNRRNRSLNVMVPPNSRSFSTMPN